MLDEPWYQNALALATTLHAGQLDKAGQPYIEHLKRVAHILVEQFPNATPTEVQAALLHDSLEDTEATPESLTLSGIAPEVIAVVQHLTRTDKRPYLTWIEQLAATGDVGVLRVKLADNLHNSDPRREHPKREQMMRTKYEPAQEILRRALANAKP
jgi:(p)ppGpp synthase/HD superfamily hydrolase